MDKSLDGFIEYDDWDDDDDGSEGEHEMIGGRVNGSSSEEEEEEPTLHTLSKQISKTQKQLHVQQQQINQMLQLLLPSKMPSPVMAETPSSSPSSPSSTVSTAPTAESSSSLASETTTPYAGEQSTEPLSSSVVPLRVMVFIDGTWLYYSLFERDSRCPINQRFGYGWARKYRIDWAALPRILCQALQDEWTSQERGRPIEITRMSVFTSYKASTLESSYRYQLFQDMRAAGYDVHQMETVGNSEKCVDIQVAVEMLHYATLPNAYDTAVLLSGDKDFMPALIRVRQKGRKVAICSMKPGVNRALYETDGLKDYDMIWLEDHLDELIIPKEDVVEDEKTAAKVHPFVMARLVWEFVKASGEPYVLSRDVGRYLKSLSLGDTTLLDEIKEQHVSLKLFLKRSGFFTLESGPERSFWIGLVHRDEATLMRAQVTAGLAPDDLLMLNSFLSSTPTDKETAYYVTYQVLSGSFEESEFVPDLKLSQVPSKQLTEDYTSYTVPMLKQRCRERGLRTSGLKAELLERVQEDAKNEMTEREVTTAQATQPSSYTKEYFLKLIREYLHASGGSANSRDIGRYLAAYKSPQPGTDKLVSANTVLKKKFGGLNLFLSAYDDLFEVDEDYVDQSDRHGQWAFRVTLKE